MSTSISVSVPRAPRIPSIKKSLTKSKKGKFDDDAAAADYESIKSKKELKSILSSLEKESQQKHDENIAMAKELQEIKIEAKRSTRDFEKTFNAIKSERDIALSEVKTTRGQLEDLTKTINEVGTKISRKESKIERNQAKIDDIQNEINTWRECGTAAIEASKADMEAQTREGTQARKEAVEKAEFAKHNFEMARQTIACLKNDLKRNQKEHEQALYDITSIKRTLDMKIEDYEEQLSTTRKDSARALTLCQKDVDVANGYIKSIKSQLDTTRAEVYFLKNHFEKLDAKLASLQGTSPTTSAGVDDAASVLSSSTINTTLHRDHLFNELTQTKKDYEMKIQQCEMAIDEAYKNMQVYLAEKENALADAEEVRNNIFQVQQAIRLIEMEKRVERENRMMPWWRKIVCVGNSTNARNSRN